MYEIGVLIGSVLIGFLSDRTTGSRRSPLAIAFISVAFLISLSFVVFDKRLSTQVWLIMLFFYGFFLGSVYHLIIITVTADLGRSHSK